jgi:uncharacterized membrane protein
MRLHNSTYFSPSKYPLVPGLIDAWIDIVVVMRVSIVVGVVVGVIWISKPGEVDNLINTLSAKTMV